jgi:hypothetical protein
MLPVAIAVAMAAFIGVFGNGAVKVASANPGDVCFVDVIGPDGVMTAEAENDVEGNLVYSLQNGVTYGMVFWIEDAGEVLVDDISVNAYLHIDSETGSGKFTSQAEIVDVEGPIDENDDVDSFPNGFDPNIAHLLYDAANTIVVDVIEPYDFNDADGNPVDSIRDWLEDVGYNSDGVSNGYTNCDSGDFVGNVDDDFTCNETTAGDPDEPCDEVDGWGFVDFECNEFGTFYIDILAPTDWSSSQDMSVKFECPGLVDSAEIDANPETVEVSPVGSSSSFSLITVTTMDENGDRIDGAEVTFTTDNCTFRNTGSAFTGTAGLTSIEGISPAGGGTTVTTASDTEASGTDQNFLADNPLESAAGTAEVVLNCATGTPGVANITAVVDREGSDIVLETQVNVVGSASANGLTLTLSPDDLECGETILATVTAVDNEGQPVSNGTLIHFTTDTSSGVVGGIEGAQGGVATVDGEASVLIATDPSNPGTHTVIAYALDGDGDVVAQTSKTYVCEGAVAPSAPPTVTTPPTGTGGTISPPNTGDAGLASGTSSASLFVIAGAVAFVLAGLASVRFARN